MTSIVSDIASLACTAVEARSDHRSATPPATGHRSPTPASPARNSPTKLHHFLTHAEDKLGIEGALRYERSLESHKIGPDVLEFADNDKLMEIGIAYSDAIRLKQAAPTWWTSPEAKCCATEESHSWFEPHPPQDDGVIRIQFEKCFLVDDGSSAGGTICWGTGITYGVSEGPGYEWWVNCPLRKDWIHMCGEIPILDGDEQDPYAIPSAA